MRDAELLFFLIIIAAMVVSWVLTYQFNNLFAEKYGNGAISYAWAGVCAFADLLAISSTGKFDISKFVEIFIAVVLTYLSMKKCKKRAAEMGADEEMSRKAMWIQFIAPLGVIGLYFALVIGFSSKKKK